MWRSHVEAVASASHSNGPEGQKCFNDHGHDWKIEVECVYNEIDEWGWGPPFGAIKDIIRHYDHNGRLNDLMEGPPSAERFAKLIYDRVVAEITHENPDVVVIVTVHEGEGNKVTFYNTERKKR